MSRIVLIPGFATDTRFSIFIDRKGPDGGFAAFKTLIQWGIAKVFRWGIQSEASFFEAVNPFYIWKLYKQEQTMAMGLSVQHRLDEYLAQEGPEIIVCHSMGCLLLLNTAVKFGLPASVKTVIFNQADIGASRLKDLAVFSSLRFINLYCPWDPNLLLSWVVSQDRRMGLRRTGAPHAQDHLLWLWRLPNLHMSGLRDAKILKILA